MRKTLIFGPGDPLLSPVGPPVVSAKFENRSKLSGEDGLVPQKQLFVILDPLSWSFWSKSAKNPNFPTFSIVFYCLIAGKHKSRELNLLHPLSDSEIRNVAFPWDLEQTLKSSRGGFELDIKVTR